MNCASHYEVVLKVCLKNSASYIRICSDSQADKYQRVIWQDIGYHVLAA